MSNMHRSFTVCEFQRQEVLVVLCIATGTELPSRSGLFTAHHLSVTKPANHGRHTYIRGWRDQITPPSSRPITRQYTEVTWWRDPEPGRTSRPVLGGERPTGEVRARTSPLRRTSVEEVSRDSRACLEDVAAVWRRRGKLGPHPSFSDGGRCV